MGGPENRRQLLPRAAASRPRPAGTAPARPRRPFLTSDGRPSAPAASNFLRAPKKKRRRAASQSTPSTDSASRRVGRLILGRAGKSPVGMRGREGGVG